MLLGRNAERERVDSFLDDAERSAGGTLVVTGDPGMGKTALLEYASERAAGSRRLEAAGIRQEADLPYATLYELLHPILDHLTTVPEAQASALRATLALEDGPPAGRLQIGGAVLSLLSAVADAQPVVCLLDDVQWVDRPSAEALAFAARRLAVEPVRFIVATSEDPAPFAPGPDGAIRLEGLGLEDAYALLTGRDGRPVSRDVARVLWGSTGGAPLALLQVPGQLTEDQLAGRRPLPHPLPVGEDISRAWLARVPPLSTVARETLLTAATSDTATMRVIAPADDGRADRSLHAALEELEEAGLLTIEAGRYAFAHPLMRSAIYLDASPSEQRAAHARIAERLAEDDRYRERCAWHRSAATLGTDAAVAGDLEQVADAATERSAHAQATLLYERAARFVEDAPHRTDLTIEAVRSAHRAGQFDRAEALAHEALGVERDPVRRVRLLHLRVRIALACGPGRIDTADVVRAATEVEASEPNLAASALAAAALVGSDDALARRALTLAAPGTAAEVTATLALSWAAQRAGDRTGARVQCTRAHALARAADADPELMLQIADGMSQVGGSEDAIESILVDVHARMTDVAIGLRPRVLLHRAHLAEARGAWRDAEVHLFEAKQLLEGARQSGFDLMATARMGALDAQRGRDVTDHVTSLRAASEPLRAASEAAAVRIEGLEALANGDAGRAAPLLATWHASPERSTLIAVTPADDVDVIEALVRAGDLDAASRFAAAMSETDDATEQACTRWATALTEPNGDDIFAAAAESLGDGHPFLAARLHLNRAERLRRSGERVRAREHLRAAIEVFDRLGAAPWAERARSELRATGERVARRTDAKTDDLTAQELQVARLIADGATYREAATALYLSNKTIEFHLGKVYRKLGIASRGELAAMMLGSEASA